ncbi:MAG: hypothetical protein ACE5E7_04925 [Anaerolineae bacterium]
MNKPAILRSQRTPSHRWLWLGLAFALAALLTGVAFTSATQAQTGAAANIISGTVTDPSGGLPPAGTIVHMVTPDGDSFGNAAVDGSGAFSLGPVPHGNYILQARPPAGSGFTPSLPVSLRMMGHPVNVGVLALTNPSVTGTVFAPDRVTPTTAVVHVYRAGHQVQSSVALSGTIQIGGLLTGTYSLQATPATNDPYWNSPRQLITITAGLTQTVDLTLSPANVFGTVTDPNGVPVAGATAHVLGRTHLVHHKDKSSAAGYFAIGDLPDDEYLLVVDPPWNAPGLMASRVFTFSVPPALNDMGAIQLRSAPKIVHGRVDTNTGVPVGNALVVANRLDHPGRQETLTAADGAYSLHLSGGLWSLTVRPTDSSTPSAWLYPNPPQLVHFDQDLTIETKTVNFQVLTADSTVIGTVKLPDGVTTPAFTVTVSLRTNEGIGRSTLIDPTDGSFSIQVPHGNYVLHIKPDDPGYAGPPPQRVHAPISDTLDLGVLTLLERDAVISGSVLDSEGNGVEGVRVVGWTHDHMGAQTRTSPDGSYVLAVTAGEWNVKPQVPPGMPYIFTGDALSVTVASMDVITGMDFILTDANNVVVGQLVDNAGNPISAQGWAAAADNNRPVNGAPIESGSFAIYLPDGSYQVKVHLAPGSEWLAGGPQPVAVAGGETITLNVPLLPQDANFMGALWDPRQEIVPTGVQGEVMADNPFAWVGDDINPANGTYQLGVSAGLWNLSYSVDPASGYVALDHHKIIPIQSGQTLGVPLPVVQRDGLIEGVVLGPLGQPLTGTVVVADGLGGQVGQVTLRTHTNEFGVFRLRVPHGTYVLHAGNGRDGWLNPVEKSVRVPRGGIVSGVILQFRVPDVILSGTTSIEGNPPVNGRVHIWAYSDDGGATHTSALLGEPYQLGLLSNTRWHIGAFLETGSSYYGMRTAVFMGTSDQTLDLVLKGPFSKPGPVVVTFDSAEPQQLELADGTQIFIPAGAMPVSGNVTLHITPIATLPHQHHARLYKYGYAFVATDETGAPITSNFNQNVIIRFRYDDAELVNLGLSEAHLKPAYFSTSTQQWTIPDSYVVDTGNNLVTMQIDHFTDFSLVGGTTYELFLPVLAK